MSSNIPPPYCLILNPSLCTHYSEWSCLISSILASPSYERRESSEKFKIEPATPRFPAWRSSLSALLPINEMLKPLHYFWLSINTCDIASMKSVMVWFVHTKFCKTPIDNHWLQKCRFCLTVISNTHLTKINFIHPLLHVSINIHLQCKSFNNMS